MMEVQNSIGGESATVAGLAAVVVAEVGNAAGGAGVVKRKRGRPPRVQANQPVVKKSKEEDDDEDVCFICFDGGSLVLCDRRGCPKAYHPACIKRDEAFFRSKAKWNCGWHICSICEKTAHHMCYTCTYSLCKGCIKKSDYMCVRGDKGFCTVCMKTIMLIENSGNATAHVDFDDKTSWEYLFKVYWVYLKGKLSLTLNDLTQAQNPWKTSSTVASFEPTVTHISASGQRSITSDLEAASEAKRRKTYEQSNGLPKESPPMTGPKEWASKELLDFVAHMKNGDTSMLSQFDVQALLLEYIKRNNLRDPRKKTQIICDSMLKNLFGKSHVGHIEMLKLLELHFLLKDESQKNTINRNKLDEYAAIDVHNLNLIYLRRNLMESLIEDSEKFREKVVGSIVQIRISGSDQKDDMYRLVQVVGTTKVDVPYKIGDKSVDVMLEVLNLDKKETVSIDTISNQELSEDECRRLRESIRCGLVRCFTVGEIQEKAMNLQSVLLDDRMETEMLRLNHLRDRASQKGQKKGLRECVQKLKLLKTPEERERRLHEIPEIHSDPKMNPDYESDDTEEYFNNEHEPPKPKFPWGSGKNTISPKRKTESLPLNDQPQNSAVTTHPEEDSNKLNTLNMGKDAVQLSGSETPQTVVEFKGPTVSKPNPEAALSSSLSNHNDDMWHYRDPSGNVQGPFSMTQMQNWSTSGYFPADMKIWATREADSLLLNKVLQDQFKNYDGHLPENVACKDKDSNLVERVNICSSIPSSTISATPYALNSVNLENLSHNSKDGSQTEVVNVCSSIPSSTISATPYVQSSVNLNNVACSNKDRNQISAPSSTIPATPYVQNSVNLNNVTCSNKDRNQIKGVDICSSIPSSTISATPYAQNSDNLNNVTCSNKDRNQFMGVNISSSIPSSTISATQYVQNSVTLDNVACNSRYENQIKGVNVCSSIPSSTISATPFNLEKLPNNNYNLNSNPPPVVSLSKMYESTEPFDTKKIPDINQHVSCNNKDGNEIVGVDVYSSFPFSTIPTFASHEKLPINNYNLNCNAPCVASLTKTRESTESSDTQKIPDINQHVSSVYTVVDVAVVDLPSALVKKDSHEIVRVQDSGGKEQEQRMASSKLVVQDSGNPPSWSTALSLVVGGTQLPEAAGDEWGRYPPTVDHQVATTNAATMDQITNLPSWHGLGETIEFSTLAEESVSDLLAEVDAMESRNGVPSPTSRRNSFLEDLFNGSIDDFSPTTDQGTPDIQLSHQSTGLQFSFGLETKPTCAVSIPQSTNSDNMGVKWSEMGGSELQPPPPRQDMFDLNYSTEGERETGTHYDQVEEKSKNHTVTMVNSKAVKREGRKSKEKEGGRIKADVAGTKAIAGFPEAEEEGEFIQPEVAPPPPPPPPPAPAPAPSLPLPPLLPLPRPPPLSMGFDPVDSRKSVSGRSSQGATSTGRVHSHTSASRSGNVGRDSHHRRSGGSGDRDRYNSNSPRERSHHGDDSGYSRSSSRASWSRQSSFNSGSGSGGGGSGYSRPPSKGQRVCKFFESGRCKKGSVCTYLHPQDR